MPLLSLTSNPESFRISLMVPHPGADEGASPSPADNVKQSRNMYDRLKVTLVGTQDLRSPWSRHCSRKLGDHQGASQKEPTILGRRFQVDPRGGRVAPSWLDGIAERRKLDRPRSTPGSFTRRRRKGFSITGGDDRTRAAQTDRLTPVLKMR